MRRAKKDFSECMKQDQKLYQDFVSEIASKFVEEFELTNSQDLTSCLRAAQLSLNAICKVD